MHCTQNQGSSFKLSTSPLSLSLSSSSSSPSSSSGTRADSGLDRLNYELPFAPIYGSMCPTQFEDSQHKICVRGCRLQPQPPCWSIRIPLFDNLFKTCITQVALQAVTLLLAQIFSSLIHTQAFSLDRTMPLTRWAYQPYSKFQIYSNSVYGG